MSHSIFRWSVPLLITAVALSRNSGSLSATVTTPGSWGVAYFEPPRSIGTPLEDIARVSNNGSLSASVTGTGSWGVAYFEPPRSIGTPLEDIARVYTGFGLAAKIEGRLRLDTDASLTVHARQLIRRRLALES
jgi:hypothetical protein